MPRTKTDPTPADESQAPRVTVSYTRPDGTYVVVHPDQDVPHEDQEWTSVCLHVAAPVVPVSEASEPAAEDVPDAPAEDAPVDAQAGDNATHDEGDQS